jgi:hypothetical protein
MTEVYRYGILYLAVTYTSITHNNKKLNCSKITITHIHFCIVIHVYIWYIVKKKSNVGLHFYYVFYIYIWNIVIHKIEMFVTVILLCICLHSPVISSLSGPNILLNTLFSICYVPLTLETKFHTHTKQKLKLYFLTFTFLDGIREDKYSDLHGNKHSRNLIWF